MNDNSPSNFTGSLSDESSLSIQSDKLLTNFKDFFKDVLDKDVSVTYDDKTNCLKKLNVNSQDIVDDDWEKYQLSHMSELMAISALEMGRKAIMFSPSSLPADTQYGLEDSDNLGTSLLQRSTKRKKYKQLSVIDSDPQPEKDAKGKSFSLLSFLKIFAFLRALSQAASSLWKAVWNRKSTKVSSGTTCLSEQDKKDALYDLSCYFNDLKHVLAKSDGMDFDTKIALVDHAREHVYCLLREYNIIQNRKDFKKLLNATVMWRLFDRMTISTNIQRSSQAGHAQEKKDIHMTSKPWELVYPAQDTALKAYVLSEDLPPADYIIKSVQQHYLSENDSLRMTTGSQERDWYSSNAQKTTYSVGDGGQGPVLTCWTNGDLRPLTAIYDDKLADQILRYNLKQLVLNSTGIDFSLEILSDQKIAFSSSENIHGAPIQLKPVCILDECQSQFDIKKRLHRGVIKIAKEVMPDVHQEHQNIVLREVAINDLNNELNVDGSDDTFLISINTPLAVHGRRFFTYHEKIKPQLNTIANRLLDNYQTILATKTFDPAFITTKLSNYTEEPTEKNLTELVEIFTVLRDQAVAALRDNPQCQQARKVNASLCCLHDTLKHWKVYSQSKKNNPNEVLNFSSSLMCSAALLGDATMINIKCKSGKDRTGAMLTCTQVNFGYWSDPDNFKETGYPDFDSSFDCDKEPFLEQYKVLLGSGAWSTAVWQDCQCPALKSLGAGVGGSNTPKDKGMNYIGDGALSEKQRKCLGKKLLDFHKTRSAYNKDFHESVKPDAKAAVSSFRLF